MPTSPDPSLLTIPVIVDDPAGEGGKLDSNLGRLVRCVYFAIDSTRSAPNWRLGFPPQELPFFMLGISGILFVPVAGEDTVQPGEFTSPEDVERTFEMIELSPNLLVETAHILLPYAVLHAALKERDVATQDAFRVRWDLFNDGFDYKQNRISDDEFHLRTHQYLDEMRSQSSSEVEHPVPVRYSPRETEAFHNWSTLQVEAAREQLDTWVQDGTTLGVQLGPLPRF